MTWNARHAIGYRHRRQLSVRRIISSCPVFSVSLGEVNTSARHAVGDTAEMVADRDGDLGDLKVVTAARTTCSNIGAPTELCLVLLPVLLMSDQ
eukprot:gene9681-biopygen2188